MLVPCLENSPFLALVPAMFVFVKSPVDAACNPERFLFCLLVLPRNPTTRVLQSSVKYTNKDNFKFDENGRKFSKWLENTVGKGEIARHSQCFQKTCTADT